MFGFSRSERTALTTLVVFFSPVAYDLHYNEHFITYM